MSTKWFGWKGKILRINLSKGKITKQNLPKDLARSYVGGRGVNAKILYDELKAGIDPLSPDNILVFSTGPLNGTPIGHGRASINTKSTRMTLAEGGFGGFFAPELKYAGYDHIIMSGRSDKSVYVWIDDDEIEIRDAKHIWGKTTWETDEILKEEIGDTDIQISYIGPAAENLVYTCPIFCNLYHSGGRLGCGTVMGSKRLKAIAIRGSKGVQLAHPDDFEKAYMKWRESMDLKDGLDPFITPYSLFGAHSLVRIYGEMAGIQTRNAQDLRFEHADELSREKMISTYEVKPKTSFACVTPACGTWYRIDSGPFAGTEGAMIWADIVGMGLVEINSLPAGLYIRSLCDQLGLDFFHICYSIAWAMECHQKGILTQKDMDGIKLKFGNYEGMIEMTKRIAYREGFGSILADGVKKASENVGKGSERFALSIKGAELELLPLRVLYIAALGVAVSESGPDHTKFIQVHLPKLDLIKSDLLEELKLRFDLEKVCKPRELEGKGQFLKFLEDSRGVLDALPFCLFLTRSNYNIDFRLWRDFLVAGTGVDFTYEEVMTVGERIKNIERAFIVREGFRRRDDTIPRRMLEEPTPCGHPPVTQEKFEKMLDDYYNTRGWSKKTGIPSKTKLEELGLGRIVEDFDALGIEVE
jgi:aldehyde:ferredoxin oxidoreductase